MGPRLPRTAECSGTDEAGRQPPERQGTDLRVRRSVAARRDHEHREHLRRRPAFAIPLVRALHAASRRGRLLHVAHPHPGWRVDLGADADDRQHLQRVRSRRRRHHGSPEHPAALDPADRRPRDLGAARSRRACKPPKRAATRRATSSAARWRAWTPTRSSTAPISSSRATSASSAIPEFSNLPRKYKPSITGCRHQCAVHEANDVSFVGQRPRRRLCRVRPLGRRRAVLDAALRPAPRGVREARAGRRDVHRRDVDLP